MSHLKKVTISDGEMLNLQIERIRGLKKDRKISDVKLAEKVNYHEKSISRILNGNKMLPDDFINSLAVFFEVTPEYLRGETDFMTIEEHTCHLFEQRYKLVTDLMDSLRHFNIYFRPHVYWCNCNMEEERQFYLLEEAIDNSDNHTLLPLEERGDIHTVDGGTEFKYYKIEVDLSQNLPSVIYQEYENHHMINSNVHIAHEVIHNNNRFKFLSHGKFLTFMDSINNNFAALSATMLNAMNL